MVDEALPNLRWADYLSLVFETDEPADECVY